MKTRAGVLAAAAVVMCTVLAACGGGGAGGADAVATEILPMPTIDETDGLVLGGERVADAALLKKAREGSVVWYTGSGAESAELTAARFTAETGVHVEMTRLPSGKLSERVLSESGAGRLAAGVVTVTDPVIADQFAAKGVYVPHQVPAYDRLAGLHDVVWKGGQYYTAYYSAYAFAYNTQLVAPADVPTSWLDLLKPRWKGVTGIVHAGAGGTVQGLAQFQEEQLGPDYWTRLAAQKPRIFDTTSTQLEALARGEITIATAGFNSTYGAQKAGAPIKLVIPKEGVSGTLNLQGLTAAGKTSPAAQLFMNWTMSKTGQEYAAAQGFVGARTDIEQAPTGEYQLPNAADDRFKIYTAEDARKLGTDIVARWNTTFGFSG